MLFQQARCHASCLFFLYLRKSCGQSGRFAFSNSHRHSNQHDFNTIERRNIEVTPVPDGPLVDGSTGQKIVAMLSENDYYLHDIPVGKYKITARDVVTKQQLGLSIADSFKPYASSVAGLFVDDDFPGSTHFRLAVNIGKL